MSGNKEATLKFLNKFDKFEKTDYIPINRGSESPFRKKIIAFLRDFTIDEIQKLKCVDIKERNKFTAKIRYYASELLPKKFLVTSRFDDGEYVFIKRLKSDGD